jgi:hypothetical protein
MAVPNSFASATSTIPLANLDANFAYYDAAYAIAASTMTINYTLSAIGSVALSPANLNVVISPTGTGVVTINPAAASTINNTSIGVTTAAAGRFTTLTSTGAATLSPASANVVLSPTGTGVVTINPATAGTIDNASIGVTTAAAGRFTTLTATGAVALSPASANVVMSPTGTGVVTINPATAGTINRMSIGATVAAAGAFTTLSASSTVSGTGFSTYLASPPPIGSTVASTGKFSTITSTGDLLMTGGGEVYFSQPAPTALTATATLTVAQIITQIITGTSATPATFTLPTGTLMDGGVNAAMAANMGIDWSVINLGSATGAITMAGGTGHTYVGNAVIAIVTSARFRTRKTAAATYITYRIA